MQTVYGLVMQKKKSAAVPQNAEQLRFLYSRTGFETDSLCRAGG